MQYRIVIKTKSGEQIAQLDAASRVSYSFYLNKPGAASFTLPLEGAGIDPDDISLGFTELFIYRGTDEVLVWAGEIQTGQSSGGSPGKTFGAMGWGDQLASREVGDNVSPLAFTDTDLSQIISDLLDQIQFGWGDFGFTMGTVQASRNADRTYEFTTVKQAIEGLSNSNVLDGIDFEITPDKVINTFYPRRGRMLDDVVFETGVNIIDWSESGTAANLANTVRALGAGDGSSMLTATSTGPDELLDSYRIREKTLSFKDVSEATTLQSHADRERLNRQGPQQIVTITTNAATQPGWGAYELGDTMRVRITKGLTRIDGLYRIYGIEVRRSDTGSEEIGLTFNPD